MKTQIIKFWLQLKLASKTNFESRKIYLAIASYSTDFTLGLVTVAINFRC